MRCSKMMAELGRSTFGNFPWSRNIPSACRNAITLVLLHSVGSESQLDVVKSSDTKVNDRSFVFSSRDRRVRDEGYEYFVRFRSWSRTPG